MVLYRSFLIILLGSGIFALSAQQRVDILTIDGVINPAASEYLQRTLEVAAEEGVHCVVIQLDTPGGLVDAMRDMTKEILGSGLPVVVYVAPAGARAASAGTFITLAGHVAAMAPGTNIGAASVVSMGMRGDSATATLMRKATNDAVAFIKSIAEQRGRNAEWAEKAVTEAASVPASEALRLGVIDLIAPSLDSLLAAIDGRMVKTTTGEVVLQTANAEKNFLEMPLRFKILDTISDPNIAYILFIIGLYGLFFELYNPGAIFPGVIGGICIILAFYAMNTLPVNYAGVLLILLSVVLFLLEIKIPSYGVLSIGGVIAFILGSVMLYDSDLPFMKVSWEIIGIVSVVTALFFLFAVGLGLRAQKRKPAIGREYLLDTLAEALDDFENGRGQVLHEGEIWNAVGPEGIRKGEQVRVIKVEGLRLTVERVSTS